MPTMKDIARRAGVSYGTVSNVLNKRGNVSARKIRLVEKAAEELGYSIHEKASDLRSNKRGDIAFVIPTLDDFKLRSLYNLLRKKLAGSDIRLNVYITDFNPVLEESYARLATRTHQVLIVNSCLQKAESLYKANAFLDSTLIFINSRLNLEQANVYQINFDSRQLEKDLLDYLKRCDCNNVLVFADNDVFADDFINIEQINYVKCSHPFNLSTAIDLLNERSYDAIIVTSTEKHQSIVSALQILKKPHVPNLLTLTADDMDFDSTSARYHIDLNPCVEHIESILHNSADTHHINLPFSGFLNVAAEHPLRDHIRLLMIESPATTALIKILPYMEQLLGFSIHVNVIKYNEYDRILASETQNDFDLIRIDMAYLPEIAGKIFKPLDGTFKTLTDKMIKPIKEYTDHGDTMYALPFDIACQVLMYRSDVLNNQRIRREYYEETRQADVVPTNYQDYNSLEAFIETHYGDIFKGSTVCTGSSITCGNEFMIRVSHPRILDEHGQLRHTDKAVADALKSYLKSVSKNNASHRFWDDVIKEYAEGHTVMSIVYSN
ncbi:MAG: LacI family DNA-binding transcriptional regulator, partial [Acholeplasmatales bacterium]